MSDATSPTGRRAAILTVSDRAAAGKREDASGPVLSEGLAGLGWEVVESDVVSDEGEAIRERLIRWSDEVAVPLVVTTGGTGLAPRDVTPDATRAVADREAPGIAEALRTAALEKTPHGMLSRGIAAIRGATLIVNLPGSPKAVTEGLAVLAPVLEHATRLVTGAPVDDAEHREAGSS